MKVCVVGLGYMGLPMAALLAKAGHDVLGVDINPHVVDVVNLGTCHFSEKGMPELVKDAHQTGKLRAVVVPEAAEVFVLSLPTPVDHETHVADMACVRAGVESIVPVLQGGELVVLESTSPVGSLESEVRDVVEKMRPELAGKVDYVFCPERAIPGDTVREMVENDRLVGGLTESATSRGVKLYKSFVTGDVLPATARVAEMVKLVENASRDVQIAFANELSKVCHALGVDVWEVIRLANRHPRVNILRPATGVGGHCIAIDPWFIIQQAPQLAPLMKAARAVNDSKPEWVIERVKEACARVAEARGNGGKVRVACLGLAYKPGVDDLRESPSLVVVHELLRFKDDVEVLVVEPYLDSHPDFTLSGAEEAMKQADVVVILTAHPEFARLDDSLWAGKEVVDPCGLRV